jgi:hypothetical protein
MMLIARNRIHPRELTKTPYDREQSPSKRFSGLTVTPESTFCRRLLELPLRNVDFDATSGD